MSNVAICSASETAIQKATYLASDTATAGFTLIISRYSVITNLDGSQESLGFSVGVGDSQTILCLPEAYWKCLDQDTNRLQLVASFIQHCDDLLGDFHNGYGIWSAGGEVYLEPVLIVSDEEAAIKLGEAFEQVAIYNLDTNETVYL
jgi:hypothetical protein